MEKHGLVRGLILPEIIKLISEEFDWHEEKSLDMFYTSEIGKAFADNETGLYGQSSIYIFNIFKNEMENNIK